MGQFEQLLVAAEMQADLADLRHDVDTSGGVTADDKHTGDAVSRRGG